MSSTSILSPLTLILQLLARLRPSQRADTSSMSASLPLKSLLPDFSSILLLLSSSCVVFRQELPPEETVELVRPPLRLVLP